MVGTVCWFASSPVAAQASGDANERVPVWRNGRVEREIERAVAASEGFLLVDLGEGWTPALFAGGLDPRGRLRPSTYRETFVALARERFEADEAGRARRDRYLEPYGIPPTLSVLDARMERAMEHECPAPADRSTLESFRGADLPEGTTQSTAAPGRPERFLQTLLQKHGAYTPAELLRATLGPRDRRLLAAHQRWAAWRDGMFAVQRRLRCDRYLRGAYEPGSFDAPTRNALAEMERRHRIYALGRLDGATLEALRTDAIELERRAVVRILTERALLAAGVIEDANVVDNPDGSRRTYRDPEGRAIPMRDLESEIQTRVVEAFGLQTPASTARWLASIAPLPEDGSRLVAIEGITLPPYYGSDMDLAVVIDPGDVWYDLPFDEHGRPRAQPIHNRPTLSLLVRWLGQEILLARYPTTIGGWRIEAGPTGDRWRYYGSPTGPAVWQRIVSAPVWLPPASTPASDLVTQYRVTEEGEIEREVKRYLLGPGYASAYGLVAAYHRSVRRRSSNGGLVLGGDEGIRTHGSVDYTSVWQRASHGCHRLHNHRAIRLFDFVIARRRHRRLGESPIDFRFRVDVGDFHEELRVRRSGYEFELERPLPVEVLPGQIRGTVRSWPTGTVPVIEPSRPVPIPVRAPRR